MPERPTAIKKWETSNYHAAQVRFPAQPIKDDQMINRDRLHKAV